MPWSICTTFTKPTGKTPFFLVYGAEAIIPTVDNTRTVGLVTLPGAFVGVLLGGGSALQAGASQMLVLLGILAGQAVTIVVAHRFMMQGRLLPSDLKEKLHG